MPSVDLDAGDREKLAVAERPFDATKVEARGGAIKLGRSRQAARDASELPENSERTKVATRGGEELWAEAVDDGVTVVYERQGFIDITIDRSTVITERVPFEGVIPVNEDQTASITAGNTQTSTFLADEDEVWELIAFKFAWSASSSWGGTTSEKMTITIRDSTEDVRYGRFEGESIDSGNFIRFDSGAWSIASGITQNTKENNVEAGHRVDDVDGIDVVVAPEGTDATESRDIRGVFQRLRT